MLGPTWLERFLRFFSGFTLGFYVSAALVRMEKGGLDEDGILLAVILPAGLIPEPVNVRPEIQETLKKVWSKRITRKGGALVRMIVIRVRWGNDP